MAQLSLLYDTHVIEENIKELRRSLQDLHTKLQSAKEYEISAKKILEEADALVKENEEMEKADPSWCQEKDWPQAVLAALEAQADALTEHEETRQDCRETQEKYDEYSEKLQKLEAEYAQRIQLFERLPSKKPSAPIKLLPKEEESFLKTTFLP